MGLEVPVVFALLTTVATCSVEVEAAPAICPEPLEEPEGPAMPGWMAVSYEGRSSSRSGTVSSADGRFFIFCLDYERVDCEDVEGGVLSVLLRQCIYTADGIHAMHSPTVYRAVCRSTASKGILESPLRHTMPAGRVL
jgi:hypothetical protein